VPDKTDWKAKHFSLLCAYINSMRIQRDLLDESKIRHRALERYCTGLEKEIEGLEERLNEHE